MNIEIILKYIYELEDKNYNFSALKLWEKVIEKNRKPFYLFRYGDILRLCGFFSKAEDIFKSIRIEEIPPNYKYNYFIYLGDLYKDQGKYCDARQSYLQAVNLKPDSTIPYIFLASVLMEDKDLDEAIKYLKLALTKEGDIDEVYYNLARRLAIIGEMEASLEAIDACLKIDPDFPDAEDFRNDLINFSIVGEIKIDNTITE